jgi:hypothetical protein
MAVVVDKAFRVGAAAACGIAAEGRPAALIEGLGSAWLGSAAATTLLSLIPARSADGRLAAADGLAIEPPRVGAVAATGLSTLAGATAPALMPLVASLGIAVADERASGRSRFVAVSLAGLLGEVWAAAAPTLTHPTTAVTARNESFCMALVTCISAKSPQKHR